MTHSDLVQIVPLFLPLFWPSHCARIPQTVAESLFLSKFLLFAPAIPNKCPASHTAQLSNQSGEYLGLGPHGPTIFPSPDVTQLPNVSGNVLASDQSPNRGTLPLCVPS